MDKSLVSRRQKLKLYSLAICSRISYHLSLVSLPLSWIKRSLDTLVTKYLKKWSGLARSANPARLFLSTSAGGLNIRKPSMIYQKLQLSRQAQLISSRDPCVRYLNTKQIKHETSLSPGFHPATEVRDILVDDPGASRKTLKKMVASKCTSDCNKRLRDDLRRLPVQGSLLDDEENIGDKAWATAVQSVPDKVMKFALNAVCDTLPHQSNLKRWKKVYNDDCPLCKEKQTLLHVLNHCQKALDLRRYTKRHDSVLEVIASLVKDHIPNAYVFSADLSSEKYSFPEHICKSDSLRPDIVIWSDLKKEVWLIELTVCFETNTENAATRKRERYFDLANNIRAKGYRCVLSPVQVGSRGYIDIRSFNLLREFLKVQVRSYFRFLTNISRVTLNNSYDIWKSRNSLVNQNVTYYLLEVDK